LERIDRPSKEAVTSVIPRLKEEGRKSAQIVRVARKKDETLQSVPQADEEEDSSTSEESVGVLGEVVEEGSEDD